MSDTQKKTLSVREIAKRCGVSERQIQRLAMIGDGIPDAQRKAGEYHWTYHDTPDLRDWIKKRKATRKGKRPDPRRKVRKKTDLCATAFPERSLRKWKASVTAEVRKTGEDTFRDAFETWEAVDLFKLITRLRFAFETYLEIEDTLQQRFGVPSWLPYEEKADRIKTFITAAERKADTRQ
jgi:hypothetical protein